MKTLAAKLFAMTLLLSTIAFAAPATLTGTVSDTMCKGKHMIPGKSDAECARACVKAGAKWALVSNDKVYVLNGNATALSRAAGKHVTITGEVNGNTVKVNTITDVQ